MPLGILFIAVITGALIVSVELAWRFVLEPLAEIAPAMQVAGVTPPLPTTPARP